MMYYSYRMLVQVNDSYRFPTILMKKCCLDVRITGDLRSRTVGKAPLHSGTFSLRSIPAAGLLNSGGI